MAADPALSRGIRKLRLAPLLALLALVACGMSDRPQNVLLTSLDSVRADSLTFLDERATPSLARLARRGTRFEQAISGSSWTLPAHVQMFTGCPPLLHGTGTDDVCIDPEMPTIAELLHDAGFFNAGYYTGWYLDRGYGFDRGFDVPARMLTS